MIVKLMMKEKYKVLYQNLDGKEKARDVGKKSKNNLKCQKKLKKKSNRKKK